MVCIHISVIAIFLLNFHGANSATISTEVILVHVLFNYGESHIHKFYPTDPHNNGSLSAAGSAQLTNNGKMMEFKLGSILRENYGDFLGDHYTEDKLNVRTTDTIKNHMSALLVLAGLWPPCEAQKWHPTLAWQPIPVFSKPYIEEDLLDSTFCEFKKVVLDNLSKDAAVYATFIEPHKSLFEYVGKHSGLPINNLIDLAEFYYILKTEKNIGLEMPKWTAKIYPEPLQETTSRIYEYLNYNPEVKKINVGYLLQKIFNDSVAKINNELDPVGRKMFLYSTSDETLGCILDSLKVYKRHVPWYGSAIIFELHKNGPAYVFRLRYLPGVMGSEIEDLAIPGCDVFCPVNKFIELQNDILPIISFREACDLRNTTM